MTQSQEYHSLIFDTVATLNSQTHTFGGPDSKNTWNDWHLIPSKRPTVASPGVETNMVQIPGRSGSLDMSEYLTGGIVYGDRSGSWEFIVDNDHERWVTIKDKIMEYLHGKHLFVVLEDDPNFYYEGRFTLNEWRSEAVCSSIVINYVLGPYKTHISEIGGKLWDPFNFDRDWFNATTPRRL